MHKIKNFILILLPGIIFLAFWQWFVHDDTRRQFLFASPSLVFKTIQSQIFQKDIWYHTGVTLWEATLGLFFGTIIGTVCGLLLWGNGRIDAITKPYLTILGSIPVFAIAPMMIIWFGIGLLSKVVMAGFAVFFISLLQAYEGAHITAKSYLGFARTLGVPNRRVITKIIIPGAIDWVITGFKLNVGLALMGAFIGEFVSSEAGLGYYILKASSTYDMPGVIFGLLMLSLLALCLNFIGRLTQTVIK